MNKVAFILSSTILTGCVSISQHEKELFLQKAKLEDRIFQLKAQQREKEEMLSFFEKSLSKADIKIKKQKKELDQSLANEKILNSNITTLQNEIVSLKETISSQKINIAKLELQNEQIEETEEVKPEVFEKPLFCNDSDLNCYVTALTGKKNFRKAYLDILHSQRGFMSDAEIERLRKRVISKHKGKTFISCKNVSLSSGKTSFGITDFYVQDEYRTEVSSPAHKFSGDWNFRVRNKKTWNAINSLKFKSDDSYIGDDKYYIHMCIQYRIGTTKVKDWDRKYIYVYAYAQNVIVYNLKRKKEYKLPRSLVKKMFKKEKWYMRLESALV